MARISPALHAGVPGISGVQCSVPHSTGICSTCKSRSTDIFKLKRRIYHRHHAKPAKKPVFCITSRFGIFHFNQNIKFSFFFSIHVAARTFGKSNQQFPCFSCHFLTVSKPSTLIFCQVSRTIIDSLSRLSFTQKSGTISRMMARSQK